MLTTAFVAQDTLHRLEVTESTRDEILQPVRTTRKSIKSTLYRRPEESRSRVLKHGASAAARGYALATEDSPVLLRRPKYDSLEA